MNYSFSKKYSLYDRWTESSRIMKKYPDKIPIICECLTNVSIDCSHINQIKYLVPRDLTIGQFIYMIRKRINILREKAIFLFINGGIPSSTRILGDLYDYYKANDGFIYIKYSYENTFGSTFKKVEQNIS
jgi:GABA(A) receptor-associated protein